MMLQAEVDKLPRLARYAIEVLGAEPIEDSPAGAQAPASHGFISISVNPHKAKVLRLSHDEFEQREQFRLYRRFVEERRVLIYNLDDNALVKVVKPSDASRYFAGGRRRIKAKVFKRLGRWFNCPGLLVSLTFDPKKVTRDDAWLKVGFYRSEFMRKVNIWRQRHGMPKAKCLSVIEAQPGTGYPHVHIVFPYLRWVAALDFLTATWGQAENSVDVKVKDSLSPVSYVCKYISKLEGWSDLGLSYLWANRTRLYSMSRDYTLPDYGDKRVPEWRFVKLTGVAALVADMHLLLDEYHTILGVEDLYPLLVPQNRSS